MKYRVRIDTEDRDQIVGFLQGYGSHVLVYHVLPHGNPHYHAYVEDKMLMSSDAFRARVKRYFKVDRSAYSVKKCDEDKINEYVQYLFNTKHGNKWELVSVSGFDLALLEQLRSNAQTISDDYEERTKIRESSSKCPTIFQLGVEVADAYDQLHLEEISIRKITLLAMDVCYKHRSTPEPNKLTKIISVVLARHEKGRDVLVQKCQNYFSML